MPIAVIAAGGSGDRLGGSVPKFEVEILGRSLVSYSLESFQHARLVEGVVLVVPAARLDAWSAEGLRGQGFSKVRSVAAGGETRQESVRIGLALIEEDNAVVVVHDAARPLVTPALIDAVSEIPPGADGVICAVALADTIKRVEDGTVAATLDRSRLVAVQTPQAFRLGALKEAHQHALAAGFEATDDSALVEMAGGRIVVVDGDLRNVKVTVPDDLEIAEAWMRERSGG